MIKDILNSDGVAPFPSERLKKKAEWGEVYLKGYFNYLKLARQVHMMCDLTKIEAESSDDPDKIAAANQKIDYITALFFVEQEKFMKTTKDLSVIVRHKSINKERILVDSEFIMPHNLATGKYMQELARINENIPEYDLIGSYVWYPTDFANPKEFRYWQYRRFVEEKKLEMLFPHEIEFVLKYEEENFESENQSA